MVRIEPYFHNSLELLSFLEFQKINSQLHTFGIFVWDPIDMDFINFDA
jgi:hypothetical protein